MTFVKVIFVLLVLIPVIILMWNITNRLITDFTETVKESAEQEQKRARALKEKTNHDKSGERYRGSQEQEHRYDRKESAGLKQMMEKRKRRKERRQRTENRKKDREN